MDELMGRAFDAIKSLPVEDQENMAWEIIDRVKDKTEWDAIIARPESMSWLAAEAARVKRSYNKMQKPLSITFVSVPQENLLRERSYWGSFDDLPEDVKKKAEEAYRLWRKNPTHPGLRFKKIHPDLPIFSFRVGMGHRSVGVRVDDEKVVWFWIGSFESFREQTKAVA